MRVLYMTLRSSKRANPSKTERQSDKQSETKEAKSLAISDEEFDQNATNEEPNENNQTTNEEPSEDNQTIDEETNEEEDLTSWLRRIKISQDKHRVELTPEMTIDQHEVIRRDDRAILPAKDRDLIERTIRRIHNRKHQGVTATRVEIRRNYSWKNMNQDIKRFVTKCDHCQTARRNRAVRCSTGQALQLTDIESIPIGSIIGIDIMTIEAQQEDRASCLINCTCLISKRVRARPLVTQLSIEIVDALEKMFSESFYPLVIVMDNAPSFRSRNMKRFAIRRGIRLCFLPPHASPYAGWIERSHQNILTSLRILVSTNPGLEWHQLLPEACYLANSRPYRPESPLCPLNLVYPNSTLVDLEREPDNIEELIKTAGISHLTNAPEAETTSAYQQKWLQRRRRQLKAYEYTFNKTRREVQDRLSERLKGPKHAFEPGSFARYYRPTASKVKARWSPPCKIISANSSSTRVIQKPDGSKSTEWIGNLTPALAPECSAETES